jgi:hypothetical protein
VTNALGLKRFRPPLAAHAGRAEQAQPVPAA